MSDITSCFHNIRHVSESGSGQTGPSLHSDWATPTDPTRTRTHTYCRSITQNISSQRGTSHLLQLACKHSEDGQLDGRSSVIMSTDVETQVQHRSSSLLVSTCQRQRRRPPRGFGVLFRWGRGPGEGEGPGRSVWKMIRGQLKVGAHE